MLKTFLLLLEVANRLADRRVRFRLVRASDRARHAGDPCRGLDSAGLYFLAKVASCCRLGAGRNRFLLLVVFNFHLMSS